MAPPEKQEPTKKADEQKPRYSMRMLWLWLLIAVLFMLMFNLFRDGREQPERIRYNPDFVRLVEDGKIRECEIVTEVSGAQHIIGELAEVDPETGKPRRFKTDVVVTDALPQWLQEHGVRFSFRRQNLDVWRMIQGALPLLLVLGLLYFLFVRQIRSVGQGAMGFGRSRARLLNRESNKVTFQEVAGVDEAREEVWEIVEFLKDPKKFQSLGGRMPKGVLLTGPPGTGKTLLAKAIAGEAGVPFFSISGSDFVEMFVGVGASRVRDMFEQAKKNAPCIIFLDEIDAVGRSRFTGIGGGHDEREQTLNALLVEMDGFETQDGIVIIAATNRPDVLDNALLRPGRFDRRIVIDLPILEGREAILKIHSKNIRLGKDADLKRLARGTPGFSGADLANLLNEAALLASRQGKDAVNMAELEEARDKVRWGRERRSHVLDEEEKRQTAFHESGHALVMAMVEKSEPIHKLTIIPRGVYLGATMQLPEKDRSTECMTKLKGMLAGFMGGRVAEEMMIGDVSTGAANDLKQATHLARLMVCDWGMSSELGPRTFGNHEDMIFLGKEITRNQEYSEDTARLIDAEVSKLLRSAYDQARKILESKRDKLEMIARLLIERETLDGRDVEEIAKFGRVLSDEERAHETQQNTQRGQEEPGTEHPERPVPVEEPSCR